jgi:membrane protein
VVLFGAELSFACQNVETYEYQPDSDHISLAFKKVLTLQIAHLLIKNFEKGDGPPSNTEISNRLKIPIRLVDSILHDLVESGVVAETRTRQDHDFGYQPARDIHTLSIKFVIDAIERNGSSSIPVARNEEFSALAAAIAKFREEMEASPANKLLKDI